eukprot:495247_1
MCMRRQTTAISFLLSCWLAIFAVSAFLVSYLALNWRILISGQSPVWIDCLVLFTIAYFTYRYFYPRRRWPTLQQAVIGFFETFPYFRTELLVHDWDSATVQYNGYPARAPIGVNETANGSSPQVPLCSNNMFAFYPHGCFCMGFLMNGVAKRTFFAVRTSFLGAGALNMFPLISDLFSWLGLKMCNPKSLTRQMEHGHNVALLPGGFDDIALYEFGKYRIFLKERKGFIKYALRYGYNVFPVFSFGEERVTKCLPLFDSLKCFLAKLRFPPIVPLNPFPFSDVDMVTVVGAPIKCPLINKPTRSQVDEYHKMYSDSLIALFEKYKSKYGSELATLEVF